MSPASPPPELHVRHVQLARAVVAALAAAMITFIPDHSAQFGLSVFSGFAIATALILYLSVWLVYPAGDRAPAVLLATIATVAGMVAGLQPLRSDVMFFSVVASWAVLSGITELLFGVRARRRVLRGEALGGKVLGEQAQRGEAQREDESTDAGSSAGGRAGAGRVVRRSAAVLDALSQARDGITVGIIGLVLAAGILVVPTGYALTYTVAEAQETFTLTGIIIAVGIFGGYAAIVAVYLGIAGLSPRRAGADASTGGAAEVAASDKHFGGAA